MRRMTNEEAIEVLDAMKVKVEIPKAAVTQYKRNVSLDMAIEALSKTKRGLSEDDLISRQAILKHIEKIRQGVQMMDDTHRASIIMNGMYLCEKAVRNQPSAQPKRETGQWLDNETTFSETGRQTATCSVCGLRSTRPLGEFCRWCGAQMTEGDDKNEGD